MAAVAMLISMGLAGFALMSPLAPILAAIGALIPASGSIGTAISSIGGIVTATTGAAVAGGGVGCGVALIEEKLYSLFRGKVVQILGPKQVGKNSVYNTIVGINNNNVDPTSESTEDFYQQNKKTKIKILENVESPSGYLEKIFEVSGERVDKWKTAINSTNPHGIIYVVDSCTEYRNKPEQRKTKLNLEAQGLYEIIKSIDELKQKLEQEKNKLNLTALLILVNKIDRINEEVSEKHVVADRYRDELFDCLVKDENGVDIRLKEHKKQFFPSHITIMSDIFCAEDGVREKDPYLTYNLNAILNFWVKLLGKDIQNYK